MRVYYTQFRTIVQLKRYSLGGQKMRESFTLELGRENRIIRGDVYTHTTDTPKPTILFLHGFKGFKDWSFFPILAETLAKEGFTIITFNFSMNGIGKDLKNYTELDKFGRLTYSREQEDISFVLEQVQRGVLPFSKHMNLNSVGLFGHSRGGGNSILYALDHPDIHAIVVWNSIYRVNFFETEVTDEIEKSGVGYVYHARTGQQMPITQEVLTDIKTNKDRFNLVKRLPTLSPPLLIIQGDNDHPQLVNGALLLANASSKATLYTIEGADHTMGMKHPYIGDRHPLL